MKTMESGALWRVEGGAWGMRPSDSSLSFIPALSVRFLMHSSEATDRCHIAAGGNVFGVCHMLLNTALKCFLTTQYVPSIVLRPLLIFSY